MRTKPLKSRRAKRQTSNKKSKTHAAWGEVTQWQVLKARIQTEVSAQVARKGFSGTAILNADKLGYQHGGDSRLATLSDLQMFATSLLNKGLARSATTIVNSVVIELTETTTSILSDRKQTAPKPTQTKPRASSPEGQAPTVKFNIPSPQELLGPIISQIANRDKKYADVRTKVASVFGISSTMVSRTFVDPETRKRKSFELSFNQAVQHLQKVSFVKATGKSLGVVGGAAVSVIPPYVGSKPAKARAQDLSSSGTAKLVGAIDVGRLINALPDKNPYDLLKTWKNAVRILGDKTRSPMHADAEAMSVAISNEWDRRAKTLADDAYFKWPTTDAPGGRRKEQYRDLRQEGMLRYLDYRVGKDGEHSTYRHALLTRIFENALPPVFDRLYVAEWGPVGSSIRLHKMAHCLASFAKNFKYQNTDKFDEAIKHWEQDLEYLHDRYYVGRFGFGWPTTTI